MKSIAIIGGGITGLTAAFELKRRNVPVTLFEAGSRAGGVIETVREDGYLAECGPNTLLETSPKIGELVRTLGLESRRLYSNPEMKNRYIVRGGRPVAMPLSAGQFVTTKLFSLGTKLGLLKEPFIKPCPPDVEENLAEFVVRRLGREFLDYAINPFVAGVYAGDPRCLSVKHAFPKLHALEQKYGSLLKGQFLGARERKKRGTVSKQTAKMMSFDEGLQVLTDALGNQLADCIRFNAPVRRIEQSPDGWTIHYHTNGGETTATFSTILLTAPAYRLAELEFESGSNTNLSLLAEIKYPPVSSVVLGFRRQDVKHPLDGFGVLIPEKEGFQILGTIFTSSLFPGRAPEGHVTLASYVGGTRAPELALKESGELVDLVIADLKRLLGVTGEPTFKSIKSYPKAIPQYEVGYDKYKNFMNAFEEKMPGILLGGHYRDGISLSDSILAGLNAADRIEERLHGATESAEKQVSA